MLHVILQISPADDENLLDFHWFQDASVGSYDTEHKNLRPFIDSAVDIEIEVRHLHDGIVSQRVLTGGIQVLVISICENEYAQKALISAHKVVHEFRHF